MKKHAAKRKWPRVLVGCLLGVFLLLGAAAGYLYFSDMPIMLKHPVFNASGFVTNTALTPAQAEADAAQMTSFVEQVHPVFLHTPPAAYTRAKSAYLAAAKQTTSVFAFRALTSQFLTSLEDGHTHVYCTEGSFLQVNWRWENGALVSFGGNLPKGAQAVSIGGVPVEKITAKIAALFPEENDAAVYRANGQYSTYASVLSLLIPNLGGSVPVAVEQNGALSTIDVPFGPTSLLSDAADGGSSVASGQMENGVFVFTLRSCTFDSTFAQTLSALKKAVAGGTDKVVVDVRGNGGGNSEVCEEILNALGMKPGTYGVLVRYSKPAQAQIGYLHSSGVYRSAPNNTAKPNPHLQLRVLTDAGTFSSATMLAVWVQDGRLGKIVGQPSANMPSGYGDIIDFTLNNSGLQGSVSHKQWLRPDSSKNAERELTPDIQTPDGADALQAALRSFG